MSDLQALIRACKDEPDDDAPRLILADWLDEHGEAERGAFIRRQVESPGISRDDCPFDHEWLGAWNRMKSPEWRFNAHRGLFWINDLYRELYDRLDEITKPPFDWTWIDGFRFGSWHDDDWTSLFRCPFLSELNWLEFSDDDCGSNLVRPLAESRYLTRLTHLGLFCVKDRARAFNALSQSTSLSHLKSLALLNCSIGRRWATAFSESEVWDELESCVLRGNSFGDTGLAELAVGRIRPKLKCLDVGFGRYSDPGLVQFARSTCFPALEELRIGYSTMRDNPIVFGEFGISSLLSASRENPYQLIISISSREPVPGDIEQFCRENSDRVVLEYWNPAEGIRFNTFRDWK